MFTFIVYLCGTNLHSVYIYIYKYTCMYIYIYICMYITIFTINTHHFRIEDSEFFSTRRLRKYLMQRIPEIADVDVSDPDDLIDEGGWP